MTWSWYEWGGVDRHKTEPSVNIVSVEVILLAVMLVVWLLHGISLYISNQMHI